MKSFFPKRPVLTPAAANVTNATAVPSTGYLHPAPVRTEDGQTIDDLEYTVRSFRDELYGLKRDIERVTMRINDLRDVSEARHQSVQQSVTQLRGIVDPLDIAIGNLMKRVDAHGNDIFRLTQAKRKVRRARSAR